MLEPGRTLAGRSARDVSAPRAHAIRGVLQLDADRMPATVFLSAGGIAEVVLLAQLAGDAGSRRIQVAGAADDFRPPAAVIGHIPQCRDVHTIVARDPRPARTLADKLRRQRLQRKASARASRKRHRNGQWNARRLLRRRPPQYFGLAVDAHRVDQYFALANQLLDLADVRTTGRI